MGEQIISGSGTQYPLIINPDGSLNVGISGNIIIGSVSAQVDSIYVQSGDNININKAEVYGSGTFNVAGTFDAGSESWIKGGSIILYGIGSSYITNQYLGSETYIPAVWYADEDICKSYKYRKEHWRKIQVRVKRVNTIAPVDGCFSLYMLEGIKRVGKGIVGKNPNKNVPLDGV